MDPALVDLDDLCDECQTRVSGGKHKTRWKRFKSTMSRAIWLLVMLAFLVAVWSFVFREIFG